MTFSDHPQAPRLGQPTPVENAGVQLVTLETLPEIAYRGQIVYLLDEDEFRVYDGVAWQNPTASAVAGTQTFVGSTTPTADNVGDLWMNNSTFQLSVWDGTSWQPVVDPEAEAAATAASAAQAAAETALEAANGAQDTADGKITTFYTTAQPALPTFDPQTGDLWINTTTNRLYRFSSPTHVDEIQDADIAAAINAAGTAQATADEKIQSFYDGTEPTGLTATDIGDLWFDTANSNRVSRWDGDSWVLLPAGSDAISPGSISGVHLNDVFLTSLVSTRQVDDNGDPMGPGIDISPDGLFGYDSNGDKRIDLPNDDTLPYVFRGNAEIDYLTVQTLTTLLATSLAAGATMTLQNGVQSPPNPPSVSFNYVTKTYTDPQPNSDIQRYGWSWDGTNLWSFFNGFYKISGQTRYATYYEKWDISTGQVINSGIAVNNSQNLQGATYIGSQKFFIVTYTPTYIDWVTGPVYGTFNFTVWNSATGSIVPQGTFTPTGIVTPPGTGDIPRRVAVSYDAGSNQVLLAQSRSTNSDKVRIWRCSPTTGATQSTMDTDFGYTSDLSYLVYGSFDFGSSRYIFGNPSGVDHFVITTSGSQDTTLQFPRNSPSGKFVHGFWWDGSNFWMMNTGLVAQRYESGSGNRWTTSTDSTWYASSAWIDASSHTTKLGPITKFTMMKRARLKLTATAHPASTTGAQFYLSKGTTVPTTGTVSMRSNGTSTATIPTITITNAVFGSNDNLTTSTFPTSSTSTLRSEAGTNPIIKMNGDGSGNVGNRSWNSTGAPTDIRFTELAADTPLATSNTWAFEVAVTPVTGRTYRCIVNGEVQNNTAGANTRMHLHVGTTSGDTSGATIRTHGVDHRQASTPMGYTMMANYVATSTTVVYFKVTGVANTGTSTALAGADLTVECIG